FVLIGTGDLAISLGATPGDSRHEQACRTVLEACRAAHVPCAIFTGHAEAAIARRSQGYNLVVVANDVDVVARGFASAMQRFKQESAPHSGAQGGTMSAELLMKVAAAIADGSIKVIDLTQTLRPTTPVIALPPPLANSNPFSISQISRYDD